MSKSIRTSVIIPVYNTEDYLEDCLESVLGQTQQDIEVILVDDGSTDRSLEIERFYAERDSRVRVITQQNLRQGTARNRGLLAAHGEFVYFMDSDDLIDPSLFETCYAACLEDDLDFVTFDTVGFLDTPDNERPDLFPEVQDRREIVPESVCDGPTFWCDNFPEGRLPFICWLEYFRRDFLIDNHLLFTEGIYFEDNDWILRIYLAAKRLRYLPLRLHYYRERPGSNVHSGFKPVLAESCFDVHAVLCEMASAETDPVRQEMIRDANNVVNARFRQFCELDPDEKLKLKTSEFLVKAVDLCKREDCDPQVRRLHLETMLNLLAGVENWDGFETPVDGADLLTLLYPGLERDFAYGHIGIYGTGRVCSILQGLVDLTTAHVTFLETNQPTKRFLGGHPVIAISDAAGISFDVVLIASTKFAEELRENVQHHLGSAVPVFFISRTVFALEWMLDTRENSSKSMLPLISK